MLKDKEKSLKGSMFAATLTERQQSSPIPSTRPSVVSSQPQVSQTMLRGTCEWSPTVLAHSKGDFKEGEEKRLRRKGRPESKKQNKTKQKKEVVR